jgi:membrane protein DedA with SNARE-associated domain
VMSRIIPGSRLPLYTAAGALGLSARVFAKTTAVCSALWVGAIFAIWRFAPSVSSAHSTRFSFTLTGALLFAPWAITKFGKILRSIAERRANCAVADSVCAL